MTADNSNRFAQAAHPEQTARKAANKYERTKTLAPAPRRQRLFEIVTTELVDMIVSGWLRPGDLLPSEAELAARFQVSKPVVRESIGQLAARGLVEVHQGKPTTVRPITSEPIRELIQIAVKTSDNGLAEAIELRRALETDIAALAATHASDADIATLKTRVEQLGMATKPDKWLDADFAFHMTLARMAGNQMMLTLMEALKETILYTIRTRRAYPTYDFDATVRRHITIVRAVADRNPDAAAAAARDHFNASDPLRSRGRGRSHQALQDDGAFKRGSRDRPSKRSSRLRAAPPKARRNPT